MRSMCKYNKDGSKKVDPLVELHRLHGSCSPNKHKTHSSGFKLKRNSTDGELSIKQEA